MKNKVKKQTATLTSPVLLKRVNKVLGTLRKHSIEQDDLLETLMLATLTKEHVIFIGPWGVNKTATIENFMHLIGANGDLFSITIDNTTQPEALLGPYAPRELIENNRYIRNIEGSILQSRYAFIGEVFNGNAATRHALHRVLNERKFENGGSTFDIPLQSAFFDSNQYPARKEDKPFYDRILFRAAVWPTQNVETLQRILHCSLMVRDVKVTPTLLNAQMLRVIRKLIATTVTMTEIAEQEFLSLFVKLQAKDIVLSPRRWYKAFHALPTIAWLDGCDCVEPCHLLGLRHILWDNASDIPVLTNILESYRGMTLVAKEKASLKEGVLILESILGGRNLDDVSDVTTLSRGEYDATMASLQNIRTTLITSESIAELDGIMARAQKILQARKSSDVDSFFDTTFKDGPPADDKGDQ